MLLSAVIVSYNTKDLTLQTVRSLQTEIDHSPLLKNETEIFIIDNHSTDGSVQAFEELKKNSQMNIIFNHENVGFARANNQAIEQATGKYILLLNSDVIVQPTSIEKMVDSFEKTPVNDRTSALVSHHGALDRLGIIAATLENPDGTLQRQGGNFPNLFSLSTHMFFLDDIPLIGKFFPSTQHTGKNAKTLSPTNKLTQQDWVGGTAMMIRKDVFQEIGLLDQNIFMYGEDVEFCMRAKDHQWDIAILPSAKITHFGSASSSSANAIQGEIKSYLYIWSKHKPFWQLPLVKGILWSGVALRTFLFGTILHKKQKAAAYGSLMHSMLK